RVPDECAYYKEDAGKMLLGALKADIAREAESAAPGLRASDNHHICMIIGYNEETQELAVSDSWGPRYELRWVHVDICKAVTYAGGFAVDF
ncbi:MAG: hypothetical protein AAF226_14985, partial [Verrucomicrobiota bacterium]